MNFFLLLITCEVVAIYAAQCPSGWVQGASSCYLFVTSSREHWTLSSYHCSLHGASLVKIQSATENNFLRMHLIDMGIHSDFWIGLSDDSREGQWKWLPSGETSWFTDWAPGQPDNGHNEDCAVLFHQANYHWNDDQCDRSFYFICEKEGGGHSVDVVG
ncbi:asialoglycoprotein receptor 1-like [Ostrea edulis]|uniref:asialoglycoprotein receptor 1-like n=1 Tax=Ostrea edulis TaxID=37623 RepID=UPI0024AEB5BC|nr:asialoglycoprotein receptor 1-like [Ostrea edulis]